MRPPAIRAAFDMLPGELAIDSFAGGGGASTGIEAAIGRPCDLAINHDPAAIAMHKANHPETKHACENIWEVDPRQACAGRAVGLAWFSPDCTHFSRAKGTKPLKKEIRGLAWVVIRWAKSVRPRVILLENVQEFQTWGPLGEDGRPDKGRSGETFRAWLAQLVDLGYQVEFRTLVAADHGAPTTRKRLYLIARCDGRPIVWPNETHGEGCANPWRAASEVIDWSLPCPSIFERKRPLAEATMRRIAAGIRRYVVGAADPFILTYYGQSIGRESAAPLPTVTSRDRFALVTPFIVRHGHYSTITGAGLRPGCGAGTFRGQPLSKPLATVCATNDKHVVVPVIVKHFGGGPNGKPAPPISVRGPLGAITAVDHHGLVAAFMTKFYGTSTPMSAPLPTVTANAKGGGHLAEVRAFLLKYHGGERHAARGQQLSLPLRTVDTANRFALVEVHGERYQIVDIGMRMLQPHELFAAQGFPSDYIICPEYNGKPLTKTAQIRLVGNSVCPPVAHAIVHANARAA